MRLFIKSMSILLFFSSSLLAYTDQDIDGVEDRHDHCPNTPFDMIVDKRGCADNQNLPSKFTLQIGSDLNFNTLTDISTNLNVYVNYHYEKWDFSLSSSNYNLTNLNTSDVSETSLYITAGYLLQYKQLNTKLSLGTKFAFSDENDRERDNDYYASIHLDYYPSPKQNVFLYYNHSISGQRTDTHYDDINSYSLGTGYMFTPKWYSALSYNHSTALFPDTEDYKALSWFNSYNFTKDLYVSCNYAHTLNDSTSEHILSLNIGIHFE